MPSQGCGPCTTDTTLRVFSHLKTTIKQQEQNNPRFGLFFFSPLHHCRGKKSPQIRFSNQEPTVKYFTKAKNQMENLTKLFIPVPAYSDTSIWTWKTRMQSFWKQELVVHSAAWLSRTHQGEILYLHSYHHLHI